MKLGRKKKFQLYKIEKKQKKNCNFIKSGRTKKLYLHKTEKKQKIATSENGTRKQKLFNFIKLRRNKEISIS